jgi:hypothetical protein
MFDTLPGELPVKVLEMRPSTYHSTVELLRENPLTADFLMKKLHLDPSICEFVDKSFYQYYNPNCFGRKFNGLVIPTENHGARSV